MDDENSIQKLCVSFNKYILGTRTFLSFHLISMLRTDIHGSCCQFNSLLWNKLHFFSWNGYQMRLIYVRKTDCCEFTCSEQIALCNTNRPKSHIKADSVPAITLTFIDIIIGNMHFNWIHHIYTKLHKLQNTSSQPSSPF